MWTFLMRKLRAEKVIAAALSKQGVGFLRFQERQTCLEWDRLL